VLQDGRAIAHVTTIPVPLWINGSERGAYWIKGLWVLPEFQRSSAGFLVLRSAVGALEPTMALVHEQAAIRLFQALGYKDLGALPNQLRILRPRSLLRRLDLDALGFDSMPPLLRGAARVATFTAPLAGTALGVASGLWAVAAGGLPNTMRIEVCRDYDPDEIEQLWRECRAEIRAGVARGGEQILRRYGANGEYAFVHVRARGRLAGLAIVRRPADQGDARLRGIRISALSDLVYRQSHSAVGLALLRGAERAARALDADALLCSISATLVRPLLRRRACLPLPPNLHVLARFPAAVPVPERLDEWWVTRGDSGGDGVF
jgi:hypothetical protein